VLNEPCAVVWNELCTWDLEVAQAFYGAVFDWTFDEASASSSGTPYVQIRNEGRANGGILVMESPQFAGVPPSWSVYFGVEDCSVALAQVGELGGKAELGPVKFDHGNFAMAFDSQGAYVLLMQMDDWSAET
jgi:predicted enzyme related to lactoylglutathione lyase